MGGKRPPLPSLPRFYAVPDGFDVWDAPTTSYPQINVATVPPGGEPADQKRKARDTSTDNSTPKYEMEGNPCYEATAVKQTTDTHLYEAVRGGGTN